jgi:hypothetical protein
MSEKQEAEQAQPQVQCLCLGLGPRVTGLLQCKSESAREHLRNARVEFLKAIRTLIDERIEYLTRTQKKGTAVPVE